MSNLLDFNEPEQEILKNIPQLPSFDQDSRKCSVGEYKIKSKQKAHKRYGSVDKTSGKLKLKKENNCKLDQEVLNLIIEKEESKVNQYMNEVSR